MNSAGQPIYPYPPIFDNDVPAGYVSSDYYRAFGSAHSNGFQMAFCDGSVRMISFTIDKTIHCWLSNRKDGYTIDSKAY